MSIRSLIKFCILFPITATVILSFFPKGTFPSWVPHPQLHLNSDLQTRSHMMFQGGTHIVLQADKTLVLKKELEDNRRIIQQALRKERIPYRNLILNDNTITLTMLDLEKTHFTHDILNKAINTHRNTPKNNSLFTITNDSDLFTVQFSSEGMSDLITEKTDKTVKFVRSRLVEADIVMSIITRSGDDLIDIKFPGSEVPDELKELLEATAQVSFRLVVEGQLNDDGDTEMLEDISFKHLNGEPMMLAVRKKVEIAGESIVDARSTFDTQHEKFFVSFTLDDTGGKRFADITKNHIGERFALVVNDKVISAPSILEPILGSKGQISGNFETEAEVEKLAAHIRAGAMSIPLKLIEQSTFEPSF